MFDDMATEKLFKIFRVFFFHVFSRYFVVLDIFLWKLYLRVL